MRKTPIRWPILALAVAGVVVAAGLLSWYMLTQRSPSAASPAAEGLTVMIVGLDRSDEEAPRASELGLMRVTPGEAVAFLVVPDEVAVKGSDGSLHELGTLYASSGEPGLRQALSELLRLDIDASVVLDAVGIASFIDGVGGLTIEVEQTVRFVAPAGEQVVFEPGEWELDGTEAIAYLRGTPDARRPLRQERFLGALAAQAFFGLPDRAIRQRAQELREISETDLGAASIQQLARHLAAANEETLRIAIVPTEETILDGQRIVHPRVVEMERLLASAMRGIELLTPTDIRIAVFNGNGIRLMASLTADYLRARGFEVTRIANAESFAYPTSYIVVLTDEAKAWVLRDALPSQVSIVFPDAFEEHMSALEALIPFGTDLLLIAGAGLELE